MAEPTSIIERVKHWYRGLPDKKRYFEFITALLTIPVLLTVIASNVLNLQSQRRTTEPTPAPTEAAPTISVIIPTTSNSASPSATPACAPGVGPVTIVSPREGEVITHDPIAIEIERQSTTAYCPIVWSYRINGGSWSDYTDRSISLYGLPPGQKQLELRIRSIVTNEEVTLRRTFMVDGETPTPTATQSGTTQ